MIFSPEHPDGVRSRSRAGAIIPLAVAEITNNLSGASEIASWRGLPVLSLQEKVFSPERRPAQVG